MLGGSAVLHAAAAGVLLRRELWPLAIGALVADHALVIGCGLWPRSTWLGPNWTRLPASAAARGALALTIDDGPDPEVTPQVLALRAEHHVTATFFCIGARIERYPELARAIVRAGHAVENHSHRHRHSFSVMGPAAIAREVTQAQQSIARICGTTPRFFRAPAGLRNLLLQPQLERLDLTLASWTRRGVDTVNGDAARVLEKLCAGLAAGDILLLHDGCAARTPAGRPVILEVLPALLARIRAAGLSCVRLRDALPDAPFIAGAVQPRGDAQPLA